MLSEPGDPVGGVVDRKQLGKEDSRVFAHGLDMGSTLGLPVPGSLIPQGRVTGEHSAHQSCGCADQCPGQRGSRAIHQESSTPAVVAPARSVPSVRPSYGTANQQSTPGTARLLPGICRQGASSCNRTAA